MAVYYLIEKKLNMESVNMKGSIFALLGGAFITIQGVANTAISENIGTWQAATLTQLTGFIAALLVLLIIKDGKWAEIKRVKPLYLIGGTFAAIVIFSNVKSIQLIGVTLTIAAVLIAQLAITFLVDGKGWFDVKKQKMALPQFIGIAMMIAGVLILSF
jgi:bacterial/archaeal transporter family-2 protein